MEANENKLKQLETSKFMIETSENNQKHDKAMIEIRQNSVRVMIEPNRNMIKSNRNSYTWRYINKETCRKLAKAK